MATKLSVGETAIDGDHTPLLCLLNGVELLLKRHAHREASPAFLVSRPIKPWSRR